jgi:hypothetical protein
MEDKYVQSLRYKLQKRVRRVNSVDTSLFAIAMKHLLLFIDSMPLLAAVRDDLIARTAELNVEASVSQICEGATIAGETEAESAAIGYVLLRRYCNDPNSVDFTSIGISWGTASNINEAFEFARTTFLEPFYEYLDEHVDDQQAILFVLKRYKQRCEWFRSDSLRVKLVEDTQRGEKGLAFDLYEFLHEQGISFYIEPTSASGIADLVAEQVGTDRVVADAKLFWPEKSKGKPYILSAFHQAYTYARDFNEPCAYLVIYKMCSEDINLLLPPMPTLFPCFTVNNKTIFFIVVDLCEHGVPASKRGVLKSYDITAEELVQSVQEQPTP